MFEPDREQTIELKKTKSGDLVLSLNTFQFRSGLKNSVKAVARPVIAILKTIFIAADYLGKYRLTLILVTALGLGFGMGLVIFQEPGRVEAQFVTPLVDSLKITPVKVSWAQSSDEYPVSSTNSLERFFLVPSDSIVYVTKSGELGKSGSVLVGVGSFNELSDQIKQSQLGDQIKVMGSNNGSYRYQVIETRQIKRELVSRLLDQNQESLVLITPSNLAQTQLTALIAR